MPDDTDADRKHSIRSIALARRQAQPDKDRLSDTIMQRVVALPEFHRSTAVLFYVDVRSEVRTKCCLANALGSSRRVVIPYCVGDELELFQLTSMDELDRGRFGILEPRSELRRRPGKQIATAAIELVLVPGVAFDRRGGRLGHGRGYYDRLLRQLRADAFKVGVAFDCQFVDSIPVEEHDIAMDCIVTETGIYRTK